MPEARTSLTLGASAPRTVASASATRARWLSGTWSGDTNAEYTVVFTTSCFRLRSKIAPRSAGSSTTSRYWACALAARSTWRTTCQ